MKPEILASLIGTLVTASATIVVAWIQTQPRKPNGPILWVPEGYKPHRPQMSKTWFLVFPIALIGGVVSYFASSWIQRISINQATPTYTPASALTQSTSPVSNSETIIVSSLNANGMQWCSKTTAKYAVEYEKGAYSVWGNKSDCEGGCWSTDIYVYKNKTVEWALQGDAFSPVNPDSEIGWANTYVKKEDAESVSRGARNRIEMNVNAGQCLTFITLDDQSSYHDNFGEITLELSMIVQ